MDIHSIARSVAVGAILSSFLAVPAQAEDDNARTARALADSARYFYEEGKLDQALELYVKAYDLDPDPLLRLNIARIHDKKGNLKRAWAEYDALLASPLDEPVKDKVRGWLESLLDRYPGRLVLKVDPPDAIVEIDGVVAKLPPGKALELKRGSHQVAVRRDGYQPQESRIEVPAGGEVPLQVSLKVRPGTLVLDCTQKGTLVRMDGNIVGTVPLAGPISVEPGRHVLEMHADGFVPWTKTIQVLSGQDLRLPVTMEAVKPEPPLPPPPVVAARPAETPPKGPEAPRPATGKSVKLPTAQPVPGIGGRTSPVAVRSVPAVSAPSPWPWVTLGIGAAALVTGGVLTWATSSERSKVEKASQYTDGTIKMTRSEALEHQSNADTYETASIAMYAVGGAAAVAGLVWGIVDVARPREAARAGRPGATPDLAARLGAFPVEGGAVVTLDIR